MDSNAFFKRDFEICFLGLLAKNNYSEEFLRRYNSMGPTIYNDIDKIVDPYILTELKTAIDYKKELEKGMSK